MSGKEWVTFTSASTAANFWELLTPLERDRIARMKRVSIGPITSKTMAELRDVGGGTGGLWRPSMEAKRHDIQGIVEIILAELKNA